MIPAFKEFMVCGRNVAINRSKWNIYINICESSNDRATNSPWASLERRWCLNWIFKDYWKDSQPKGSGREQKPQQETKSWKNTRGGPFFLSSPLPTQVQGGKLGDLLNVQRFHPIPIRWKIHLHLLQQNEPLHYCFLKCGPQTSGIRIT